MCEIHQVQLAARKRRYELRPLHLYGNPPATMSAAHKPGTPPPHTQGTHLQTALLPKQPRSLPQAWPHLCRAAMHPHCKAAGPTAGKALAQQSRSPVSNLRRALSCRLHVILVTAHPDPTCTPQHSTTTHSTWRQGGSRRPPAGQDGWCPHTARMKHCFIACLGWVRPRRQIFTPCAALLSLPKTPAHRARMLLLHL